MTPLSALVLSCLAMLPHDGYEHGGIVAADAAGNMICTGISHGDESRVEIPMRPPVGYHLVALYHTHVMPENAEYFSPADVMVADRHNVPSYIMFAGQFRVYTPGVTKMVPPSHLPHWLSGWKLSLGDLPQ